MCEVCGCGQNDHQHTHLILKVSGMHCANCSAKLENGLNALPGVHATADHEAGVVSLLLHADGDLAAAKEAILDMGFDV